MEIVERTPETKSKTTKQLPSKTVEEKKDAMMEIEQPKEKTKVTLKGAMNNTGTAVKTLFTRRKKLVVLTAMVALLCVTIYFNFALNSGRGADIPAGGGTQVCMFTTFRNNRAAERTRDIMVYENLMATSASAETRASAESRLLEIRANVAFETTAEGLIMAEQLGDIIVNRANGFVNVLIRREGNITHTNAIKIVSILQTIQPSLDIDSIHINIVEPTE